MRHLLAIATLAALIPVSVRAGDAPDASSQCYIMGRKLDQVTQLARSCSEAAFDRRSAAEADALCEGVLPTAKAAWNQWNAWRGGDTRKFLDVCPAETASARLHIAALDWTIAYHQYRLDGSGNPRPFKASIPSID